MFQDRESDVQAVAAKNLPFMLDLAKSAPTPDQPVSHIGAQIPDFVPATFPTAYGSPQTVEVNVRRALGAVKVKWQVEGSSAVNESSTTEFNGGERYGQSGVYYHRMRGAVTGFNPGAKVSVWFEAGGKSSTPFTFTASPNAHGNQVLVLSAEDYTGLSPNAAPTAGPAYLSTYLEALSDAGIPADVYDIDANGRNHADLHGVLGHYRAVVWYTGLDDYVRDPGQTVGVTKMYDDQMVAIRDYLNEGGKVLVTGQRALQSAWSQYAYNPLGRFPDKPQCRSNTSSTGPVGQLENCVVVSNDFMQYWMGANARANQATTEATVSALTLVGQSPFTSSFSLSGQAFLPRFTPTSAALPVASFPQFASQATHVVSGSTNAVGVSTADTLLWGFGIENVPNRATRAELIGQRSQVPGRQPVHAGARRCRRHGAGDAVALARRRVVVRDVRPGDRAVLPRGDGGERHLDGRRRRAVGGGPERDRPGPPGQRRVLAAAGASRRGRTAGAFGAVSGSPLTILSYGGPVSNDAVTVEFRQSIGATDALRSGPYSKTLTFTLSTTTP